MDLKDFPLEQARLQITLPMLAIGTAAILCYGWILQVEPSVAAPLAMHFLVGLFLTGAFNSLGVMVVDYYPLSPATATAANNLMRCSLGAAGSAIINIMIDTENQYQLTLVDQQIAITSAEKMYEMKACDSALWSWQPACSELAKTRAIVPGLGVTRTGTLIALIDEFHKIPESYVELFEQVAWKFLMMCSAPGLGRTLWSFSSSLGDGLGLFFGTYVFGFWSMVARVFG